MLTSANVWATVFVHLGIIIASVAYFVVGAMLMPGATHRGCMRFAAKPKGTIAIGLAISVPLVVVSLILLQRGGALASLGAFIGLAWILAGLMGGAALARHVGQSGEDWRRVARGGTLIALTWVLPLIGWFVTLPLTISTGVACLLLSARTPRVAHPDVPMVGVPLAAAPQVPHAAHATNAPHASHAPPVVSS